MLALRNGYNASELDRLSVDIAKRVASLDCVEDARTISTYLNIGSEVRTDQIVEWAWSRGKRVIVPVTVKAEKQLIFSEIRSREELGIGTFGIPEPKPEYRRLVPLEDAGAVLIPGVAWDSKGYRIGYGGGFYDRKLNSVPKPLVTIGLAFEFQILTEIPKTRYDQHVGMVETELRVIRAVD